MSKLLGNQRQTWAVAGGEGQAPLSVLSAASSKPLTLDNSKQKESGSNSPAPTQDVSSSAKEEFGACKASVSQARTASAHESSSCSSTAQVIENLSRQVVELEALAAIYSCEGELDIDDRRLCLVKEFLAAQTEDKKTKSHRLALSMDPPPEDLCFTVRLAETEGESVMLSFALPPTYPAIHKPTPRVVVLSSEFSDSEAASVVAAVEDVLRSLPGQEILFEAIHAGEEVCRRLLSKEDPIAAATAVVAAKRCVRDGQSDVSGDGAVWSSDAEQTESKRAGPEELEASFCSHEPSDADDDEDDHHHFPIAEQIHFDKPGLNLHWQSAQNVLLGRRVCYSHHICSPMKRSYIAQWALGLELCGYSKIGYPGVIIVEGPEAACREYVSRLQHLRWKHFVIRGEQTIQGKPGETIDQLRQLPRGFMELGPDAMGELGRRCRQAGLEELFLTCMKIYSSSSSW